MPGVVTNPPFGVQDPLGVRALSAISPNTRVRGTNGLYATHADALFFPGPSPNSLTGMWTVPSTRVSVGGVRVVTATSQGLAFTTSPPAPSTTVGPLVIATSDPRINIP